MPIVHLRVRGETVLAVCEVVYFSSFFLNTPFLGTHLLFALMGSVAVTFGRCSTVAWSGNDKRGDFALFVRQAFLPEA